MKTTFKVEGVEALKRTLAELNSESALKVGTVATREAAKQVKAVLVASAPVGTEGTARKRTTKKGKKVEADYGRLRDNITIRKLKPERQHQIKFGVGVGAAFWGMFLEFGTSRQDARPWMRPAFDAIAGRLVSDMGSILGKGIEREAKRLGRKARKKGLL